MSLLLKGISLSLADFALSADLELQGRTTGIFGPSGAGKTSLLDLIAGLRRAGSAFIQLDSEILTDTRRGIFIPPRRRGIGYVPQDLALFPHFSVLRNLLYGQKTNEEPKALFSLNHVVGTLELRPVLHRRIHDLSGGEQQRVALARALLASPRLLLLDEPLGSLDAQLKARILPYLTRIRDEFQVPMLYVTHDPAEVVALCDNVVRLHRGQVVGQGAPASVLNMS
jgi:molybdate transport system ATP-binding protein